MHISSNLPPFKTTDIYGFSIWYKPLTSGSRADSARSQSTLAAALGVPDDHVAIVTGVGIKKLPSYNSDYLSYESVSDACTYALYSAYFDHTAPCILALSRTLCNIIETFPEIIEKREMYKEIVNATSWVTSVLNGGLNVVKKTFKFKVNQDDWLIVYVNTMCNPNIVDEEPFMAKLEGGSVVHDCSELILAKSTEYNQKIISKYWIPVARAFAEFSPLDQTLAEELRGAGAPRQITKVYTFRAFADRLPTLRVTPNISFGHWGNTHGYFKYMDIQRHPYKTYHSRRTLSKSERANLPNPLDPAYEKNLFDLKLCTGQA